MKSSFFKWLKRTIWPLCLCASVVTSAQDFDGSRWNIATGNLSVSYIQHSPVGAFPMPNYYEAPPSVAQLTAMKKKGLVWDEDYVAWGAVEREEGKWD